MKQSEYPYLYRCDDTELVGGLPPTVDDDGGTVTDGSLCEVLGTVSGKVDSVFTLDGGVWYAY